MAPPTDRILVVDDEEPIREIVSSMLMAGGKYVCQQAASGNEALALLESGEEFSLMLSDLMMAGMDGIALLERAKERSPEMPVVMVTAVHDISVALAAIRNGAYDYLLKPFEREQLLATVRRALENRRLRVENRAYQINLESLVEARTQQLNNTMRNLERSYDITLEALGDALDLKDAETEGHSKRVTAFTIAIAKHMGLSEKEIRVIARGAFLHDIGKMAIPDAILRKPGALNPDEIAIMREHCYRGYQMLRKIPFLSEASDIVYAHQEKYDGTGYPRGLKGHEIPLGARIFSIADTLDAITSDRPYLRKEGFNHCVFVPVLGKTSVIGTLTLGSERHMRYTAEEMSFFSTTAHQLGLAVENLRLMEQVLRSHRQWTNTFDSLQDSVLVHDADFRIMKANMSLLRRLGRAPADVIGKTCQVSLPGDSGWTGCPYCLDGEGFYESRDACFGGFSAVSTSSYVEEGGKQKGTIHIVHDVTDRHLAAQKYRLLFQQMQEGVFVATPAGQLLDCNEAFVRMLGYNSRDEVMLLNLETEMYASSERRADFRRQVESQNYVRNFEVQLRRKDGSLLTAMESSFATRNDAGEIERYQGFLLDISEKKQVEDEIRRRNRELNALNAMAMIASQSFDMDEILNVTLRQMILLLEAQAGSIYVADSEKAAFRRRANWGHAPAENGRPNEVQFEEGFGELVTRSRTEVLTPDYLPHLPPKLAQFISGADSGSWIWVLLWGKDHPLGMLGIRRNRDGRYTSNDENLLVATGRQLATTIEKICLYEETCRAYQDLRHAQEQLLQSEKMSAMGQLIAGVAHELNNPLTAILGYAQLLESEQLTERSADFVAKLFRQAQRTHRVVQNLLSFARQRTPQKHKVDVLKVLEDTLALREYDLRVSGIELERNIEAGIPAVTADPHQLEQVFLNIINNAMDAMQETGKGGKLCVSLHSAEGKVHLQFHDSGPGIKEPKRIFDPFYTTKSVGKGTGLGLSICYGIIKEHGGDISARNSDQGGAIIEIRLPSVAGSALPVQAPTPVNRELVLEGRILLVEDEEAVLEFARDVLAGAGAEVVTSIQREEVQSLLLSQSFDTLVVNGKMLGDWNAAEIYSWLQENRPNLSKHVLFTFSTVPEPDLRAFLKENQIPYLIKPFEVSELLSQVRRLLEKVQSAVAG